MGSRAFGGARGPVDHGVGGRFVPAGTSAGSPDLNLWNNPNALLALFEPGYWVSVGADGKPTLLVISQTFGLVVALTFFLKKLNLSLLHPGIGSSPPSC